MPLKKSLPSFPAGPLQVREGHFKWSSPGWTTPTLSACPHREVLQPSDYLHGPLDPLQEFQIFLVFGVLGPDAVTQMKPHKGRVEDKPPSLCWPICLLMKPSIQLAVWAASTHCWLTLRFLTIRTCKSFSAGLLSTSSSPSLYKNLELLPPKCSNLCLDFLNLIKFMWVHFSSTSGSLCMASLPSYQLHHSV